MSSEQYPTAHLPITNEGFIGDPQPDILEDIYARSTMDTFWKDLAEYAPEEGGVYERNTSLLNITEGVVRGDLEMTGSIQDVRELCELYFKRQGSINSMRGPLAPDHMLKVAGRYLEACATQKERVDAESVRYAELPRYVAEVFKGGKVAETLRQLDPMQQTTFGTMLLEISYAYDNNAADAHASGTPGAAEQGTRAEALRNTFENWALQTFELVNGLKLSGITAPAFLQQHQRVAWASQYDIRFAQLARIADPEAREAQYRKLLSAQLQEAGVLMNAKAIPADRGIDGFLYEYFLPTSMRFNALMAGQQDKLQVRRATPREDEPIDGMTHPDRIWEYRKYSFDMMVHYPQHDRRVFLQTKLGQDVSGYDEGVKVYNYHTNVPNIRAYMAAAAGAMYKTLADVRLTDDDVQHLRAERARTAPLLPDELD